MMLTQMGKAFYDLAVQYEDITRRMQQLCHEQQRCLRVSSLNSLGNYLLPDIYERFIQEHPEVELQIQDMERESASRSLLAGTTDLAFISGVNTSEHLIQRPVFRESMVVICSDSVSLPDHVSVNDLVCHQEIHIEWSNMFEQWHRKTIGNMRPWLQVSIMVHLRQFMETKPCWAIVPMSIALGLKRECSVKIVETDFELPIRQISMLTLAEKNGDSYIDAFISCMKAVLSGYPGIESLL